MYAIRSYYELMGESVQIGEVELTERQSLGRLVGPLGKVPRQRQHLMAALQQLAGDGCADAPAP